MLARQRQQQQRRPLALHDAVSRSELGSVKRLMQSDRHAVYERDARRRSALLLAVERNDYDIVAYLIGKVPSLVESRGGPHHRTPLHTACCHGYLTIIHFLLDLGTSELEAMDRQGRTPLMLSAAMGRVDVTEMLLAAGASLETRDWEGNRALHYASRYGGVAACDLLIRAGCEVIIADRAAQSPLHWAAMGGQQEACELLLQRGLNPNARDKDKRAPLHHAAMAAAAVAGGGGARRSSPLPKYLGVVELLLSRGAQVVAVDLQGRRPEDYAASSTPTSSRPKDAIAVEKCLRRASEEHARGMRCRARQKAALHAVYYKRHRTVNRAVIARCNASQHKLEEMAKERTWRKLPPITYRPHHRHHAAPSMRSTNTTMSKKMIVVSKLSSSSVRRTRHPTPPSPAAPEVEDDVLDTASMMVEEQRQPEATVHTMHDSSGQTSSRRYVMPGAVTTRMMAGTRRRVKKAAVVLRLPRVSTSRVLLPGQVRQRAIATPAMTSTAAQIAHDRIERRRREAEEKEKEEGEGEEGDGVMMARRRSSFDSTYGLT